MLKNFHKLFLIVVLSCGIFLNSLTVSIVNAGGKYVEQINILSATASYNLIAAMQEKLKEKGYYKGKINGDYDWLFEQALDEYRKDNGLKNDKTLDRTLKSLGLMNGT